MRRITLKDIAQAVGLSVSCTARALKGRPDIPAATCQRVQEAAQRLGYVPDPMLTALSAYRQANNASRFRGNLAFVTPWGDEKSWLANRETGDLLRGARARAESLGYSLDYFGLGEPKRTPRQLAKILKARGIRGVLIRTFPKPLEEIAFPFEDFTCVDLFSEPHTLKLPTVSSAHAQSMELALVKLRERGCKHPALLINQLISGAIHHGWQMAFQVYGSQFFEETSVFPVSDELMRLFSKATSARRTAVARLETWAQNRNVDALLYCLDEFHVPQEHRSKSPPGLEIVCMDLLDPECGISGIHQDRLQAGAVAVEWLQSLLLNSPAGVPRQPIAITIPGSWKEAPLP